MSDILVFERGNGWPVGAAEIQDGDWDSIVTHNAEGLTPRTHDEALSVLAKAALLQPEAEA